MHNQDNAELNPVKVAAHDEESILERISNGIACRCLIYRGYAWTSVKLLDFTKIIQEWLKGKHTFNKAEWEIHKRQIKSLTKQASQIIEGKLLVQDILDGRKQDKGLLDNLKAAVLEIRTEIENPLMELHANVQRAQRTKRYQRIVKKAETIYTDRLKSKQSEAFARLEEAVRSGVGVRPSAFDFNDYTVVSIDLKDYTTQARNLQTGTGTPRTVFDLNRKLMANIRNSLRSVGVEPTKTPIQGTGDGALVFLENATAAIRFALEVRNATAWDNLSVDLERWRKVLRIGISTGPLSGEWSRDMDGNIQFFDAGGIVIIEAVRYQSLCDPGSVLISDSTHHAADRGFHPAFSVVTTYEAKGWELPPARPLRLSPGVAWSATFPSGEKGQIGADIT